MRWSGLVSLIAAPPGRRAGWSGFRRGIARRSRAVPVRLSRRIWDARPGCARCSPVLRIPGRFRAGRPVPMSPVQMRRVRRMSNPQSLAPRGRSPARIGPGFSRGDPIAPVTRDAPLPSAGGPRRLHPYRTRDAVPNGPQLRGCLAMEGAPPCPSGGDGREPVSLVHTAPALVSNHPHKPAIGARQIAPAIAPQGRNCAAVHCRQGASLACDGRPPAVCHPNPQAAVSAAMVWGSVWPSKMM